MKPLVVRIIARLNVGGPAQHVLHLSRGLRSFDTVLVSGMVQAGEVETAQAGESTLHLQRVTTLGRALRPLDDLHALVAIFRLLRRHRPLIVHTHTAKAGTLGRIAAVLARVPIRVHTYHGHVFHGYFGKFQTRLVIAIERMLARITTCIVTISEAQRQDIVRTYRVAPAEKVTVIPLGLDLAAFANGSDGANFRKEIRAADDVVIASVGRMAKIKNQSLLLNAFAGALRTAPAAQLVFVGSGEEEDALKAAAARLGIDGRIRFLGWRSDLPSIYAGCDVVALSSANEGTPVCLIEALAAGCRVVATDVGGVRDVVRGSSRALLVPSADESAFTRALVQAYEQVRKDAARDDAGRREITARYGVDRLITDVESLYRQLIMEVPVRARVNAELSRG